MTGSAFLAGVDVGGTNISVLLADADLKVHGRRTIPTRGHGSAVIVDHIAEVVDGVLHEAGGHSGDIAAIGVGVPGRVDVSTGTVSLAVNLHWRDLPLGPQLSSRLGAPVWIENDVRAAAAAIHQLELAGPHRSLAYLSIGTGIAAGIVLDGKLWRGASGMAGEIGHIVVRPDGPECACGMRGCLEAVASGPAILRQANAALATAGASALQRLRLVGLGDIFEAAAAGDELASRLVNDAGEHLAWAIHLLVMAYDVEVVALGGGATAAGPGILDAVLRGIDRRREASPLAREVLDPQAVRLLSPDSEPGSWGALLLARHHLPAPD
jgi:glucokinase